MYRSAVSAVFLGAVFAVVPGFASAAGVTATASVSGDTATVSAEAEAFRVGRIEIFVGGTLKETCTAPNPPKTLTCSTTLTSLAPGTYSYLAKAYTHYLGDAGDLFGTDEGNFTVGGAQTPPPADEEPKADSPPPSASPSDIGAPSVSGSASGPDKDGKVDYTATAQDPSGVDWVQVYTDVDKVLAHKNCEGAAKCAISAAASYQGGATVYYKFLATDTSGNLANPDDWAGNFTVPKEVTAQKNPEIAVSSNAQLAQAVKEGQSVKWILTITNAGGGTLQGKVQLSNTREFSCEENCSYTLAKGESVRATVEFEGGNPGVYSTTVTLTGAQPKTFGLDVTVGAAELEAAISKSPGTVRAGEPVKYAASAVSGANIQELTIEHKLGDGPWKQIFFASCNEGTSCEKTGERTYLEKGQIVYYRASAKDADGKTAASEERWFEVKAADAAALETDPADGAKMDFGTVHVDKSGVKNLAVKNRGKGQLQVTPSFTGSAAFAVSGCQDPATPNPKNFFFLGPGESRTCQVLFVPKNDASCTNAACAATLTVTGADTKAGGAATATFKLTGTGTTDASKESPGKGQGPADQTKGFSVGNCKERGGAFCIENPLNVGSLFGPENSLLDNILDFLRTISIPIAVIMVLVAGFLFVTAAGNPAKIQTARNILIWTAIGFAVILLGSGLVSIVQNVLGVKPSP